MSPEQIRADKVVDARTDVWSLGVILYEVLAGVLPFQSSSHSGLFVKIVTEPPVPLAVALPGIAAGLAAAVEKCLSPRADARYASAADLARELRSLAGVSLPEPVRVEAPPPRMVETRAAPVSVPDLALPAPKPNVRAAPKREAAPPIARSSRPDIGSELVPITDLRLDLAADPAMMRPGPSHRVARATHGMRNDVAPEPEAPARSLFGMGVMWVIVLAITAGLTGLVPGGWPVVAWASELGAAPGWMAAGAAALALLLGVLAFVAGARAEPVSWGMVIAGPGLLVDAVILGGFVVHGLPSLTGGGGLDGMARVVFPWPTMLLPVGLCVVALRQAWFAWGQYAGKNRAGAWIVLAAFALFGAVEIARGADSAPPGSSLVS